MNKAKNLFTRGDRVCLSALGREHFPVARDTGVVVGFGRSGNTIYVKRDGLKLATSWHMDFWEPQACDVDGGHSENPSLSTPAKQKEQA